MDSQVRATKKVQFDIGKNQKDQKRILNEGSERFQKLYGPKMDHLIYDGNSKCDIQIRDSRSKVRDNPKLYSRYYLSRREMRKDMLTLIF